MKLAIFALVLALITIPMLQVQAQGRDDLSEEEQALLDRVLVAIEGREDYENYNLSSEETQTMNFVITVFGQSVEITQKTSTTTDSLTILDNDTENVSATTEVTYEETESGTTSSYTIAAEVIFVDGVVYVDAELLESSSDIGPIDAGWQAFDDASDIPEALEELNLDDYLDDDEISPLERTDLIESTVSSISSEVGEIDGVQVENITLTFSGEGLLDLFAGTMGADDEENPFLGIILENVPDGELTLVVSLDENDELVATALYMSMSFEDILLDDYDIEDVPEGTTLSVDMEIVQSDIASNINADVEPIEAPVE